MELKKLYQKMKAERLSATSQPKPKTARNSELYELYKRRRATAMGDAYSALMEDVKSFSDRASSWLGSYDAKKYRDTAENYDEMKQLADDFSSRAQRFKSNIETYGGSIDPEWVSLALDAVSEGEKYYANAIDALAKENDYYRQFGSEEGFSAWLAEEEERQRLLDYDIASAEAELERLKGESWGLDRNADSVSVLQEASPVTWQKEHNTKVSALQDEIERAKRAQASAAINEETVALLANLPPDFDQYVLKGPDTISPMTNFGALMGADYIGEEKKGMLSDVPTYAGAMTEDEKALYRYYYAKYGEKKANAYLESIRDSLTVRVGEEIKKSVGEGLLGKLVYGAFSGLYGSVEGAATTMGQLLGEDVATLDAADYASVEMRENMTDLEKIFFDLAQSSANMLPSILASVATGSNLAGATALGVSASGNAYNEAIRSGFSEDEAKTYQMLIGASEAGLQYLLGGIGKLGGGDGGIFGALGAKALGKIDNAIARVALTLGAGALDEASEEMLQTVLESWFKSLATGTDFEAPNIDEVLYSGLLGALTSGLFEVGGTVGSEVQRRRDQSDVYSGDISALIAEGLKSPEESESRRLAEQYQKLTDEGRTLSNGQAAKLVRANEKQSTRGRAQSTSKTARKGAERSEGAGAAEVVGTDEKEAASTLRSRGDGKVMRLADGKTVSVEKIVSVKNGEAVVKLSDGSTAKSTELDFGSDTKNELYNKVSAVEGMVPQAADAIIGAYSETGDVSVQNYVRGAELGYLYGAAGIRMDQIPQNTDFYGLSESQRLLAYGLGEASRAARDENRVAEIEHGKTQTGKVQDRKKDSVRFEEGFSARHLTERQIVSKRALSVVAKALGVDFVIHEKIASSGKHKNANGWYDTRTGEVHIALDANREGTMLFTAAHELTHLIRDWSPKKFKVFADLLLERFAEKGASVDTLVARQIEKAKANGRTLSFDAAYEEVVADACESMLTDGEALREISKAVREQDASLWDRIRNYLSDLINRLRAAYKGLSPSSTEGKLVSEMQETAKEMQKLWTEALVDAAESRRNSQTSERTEGEIFSFVEPFVDKEGNRYDNAVLLDTDAFNNVSPKNWWRTLKDHLERRTGKSTFIMPVVDENGNTQMLEFAKSNERVSKNGGNQHPVLGELYKTKDNISKLSATHIDEIVEVSKADSPYYTQSEGHGWLDAKGWLHRTANVINTKNGNIYQITMDIAKAEDGRTILYALNGKTKRVGNAEVNSLVVKTTRGSSQNSNSEGIVSQDADFVKGVTEEIYSISSGSVSNRSLLANALESAVRNDAERKKLAEYKDRIACIEAEEARLSEIRDEVRALSKDKRTNADKIRALQQEELKSVNRINLHDKKLLELEASKPLKNVLERETRAAYERGTAEGKEAMEIQRIEAEARLEEQHLLAQWEKYRKLHEVRRDRNEKLKAQREHYEERLAAVRSDRDEKIQRVKDEARESRMRASDKRYRTELRHKILRVVQNLNRLLSNPTKERHIPEVLRAPVGEAMRAIDAMMNSKQPEGKSLKAHLEALKNAYVSLGRSEDPVISGSFSDLVEDRIEWTADLIGDTGFYNMTAEQLQAVYEMYTVVLATVRKANTMFIEGKNTTVRGNSEAVKMEVRMVGGHHDRVLKITKGIKNFSWDMLKPLTAMKLIGSETFTGLFDNVRKGEDTWATDVGEAKYFFREQAKKYHYWSWDFEKQHAFKDRTNRDFSLSLGQMLSLYAYSKREQADKHLDVGGFIFDDAITVTKKKHGIPLKYEVNDATPYLLSKTSLAEIVAALTPEQRGFADAMQTYLSEVLGEKGNEVSMEMYDIRLYAEKYYFPLRTARYFRVFDPEQNGDPKIKNMGFSKKTVPKAGNPIVLSDFTDVWSKHVNDMSMYHAFVLPLEDFMRVYNYCSTQGGYDSVQEYIKNAYGKAATDYVERLLRDLNGGARMDPATNLIGKGISLFKKSAVFASASVVIQQPSAIARAFAYIDPKYFGKATPAAVDPRRHDVLWAECKQYAPVALIKEMGYFDTNMGKRTTDWIKEREYKGIKEKTKALVLDGGYRDEVLSRAPALADEVSWTYIWEAVKVETKEKTGLSLDSEALLRTAGERFTEVVVNTQVYDSVLSRSSIMRSEDTGMKMATAFMAEPTTALNMMIDAVIQGKRGNTAHTKRTVGAVASSILLNAVLVSLVYAARDDDEGESWLEKYVESLTSEVLDGFNPLTYIPFVKDIWSIARGYDVERSDVSVISNLWSAVEGLFSDSKGGLEKTEKIVGSVAAVFGLPLKNIWRDIKGVWNLVQMTFGGNRTSGRGLLMAVGDAAQDSVPLLDRIIKAGEDTDGDESILSPSGVNRSLDKGDYTEASAIIKELVKVKVENGQSESQARSSVRASVTAYWKPLYKEARGSERTRIRKLLYRSGLYGTLSELDDTLATWRKDQ